MADIDWYADGVATIAAVLGGWSLGWQIKSNWWDRPNIVLQDDRVAIENEYDRGRKIDLGWSASVTVSNTGNADTTLHSVEWEFDSAPEDYTSTFVAGDSVDLSVTMSVTDIAPGVRKTTIGPDDGSEFQPIVMGRNHTRRYEYRIGPLALDSRLGKATRARPVARFIDRKRRFGPKRHGVEVKYGDWTLVPRLDRKPGEPMPPGIRAEEQ